MAQSPQEDLEKVPAFICGLTPKQGEVVHEMQKADFSGPEPERAARAVYDSAMRAGFQSSAIHMIMKHFLSSRCVVFNRAKLNHQREMAKRAWENVGTAQHPPPPPLVLDPGYKSNPDNQR